MLQHRFSEVIFLLACCLMMHKIGITIYLVIVLCCSAHAKLRRSSIESKSSDHSIDGLTQDQLKQISDLIKQNPPETCQNEFEGMTTEIIRTNVSLANGAKFLSALPNVNNADECRSKCCHYSGNGLQKCDVAVYQLHSIESKPQCYLFSCYNAANNAFSCVFSSNSGFISFKRRADGNEKELEEIAHTQPYTETDISTASTTSVQVNVKSAPATTTTDAQPKTTHATEKVETVLCRQKCKKFQWKCDNGCCISHHGICDGTPHCSDNSDEVGCPTPDPFLVKSLQNLTYITEGKSLPERKQDHSIESLAIVEVVKIDNTGKIVSNISNNNHADGNGKEVVLVEKEVVKEVDPDAGAVLPLAIGLAVTACVLVMVACRVRKMKQKLGKRGKPLHMDESDYLINGMYL